MLPFKKCDNCTGPVCICGQYHSDKNMRWCDRSDLEIENDRLKAENARYREALEWYADSTNWIGYDSVRNINGIINDSILADKTKEPVFVDHIGRFRSVGGRRAREALKGE